MPERIVSCANDDDMDYIDRCYATEDIVRCGKCKYWNETDNDCKIKSWYFHTLPDWYCADGVRRDGDG